MNIFAQLYFDSKYYFLKKSIEIFLSADKKRHEMKFFERLPYGQLNFFAKKTNNTAASCETKNREARCDMV